MIETIEAFDVRLFVFLNSLGSPAYDGFWLFVTKQLNWTPLFILILYLIYRKIGLKQSLILLLFVAVLITCTDQTTNLFKNTFQRLRPCNNTEINSFIRIVQSRNSFSFFSGHAANSMAVVTFIYLLFRNKIKYIGFLFIWPLVFAYSRIYLGLHYPLDIFTGYLFGSLFGFLTYKIFLLMQNKYFLKGM